MIRKIAYSLSLIGSWLAVVGIAHAQTCEYNGRPVECPQWLGSALPVLLFVVVIIVVIVIASLWRIFTKAGKPGWASIVPIYNVFVELDIIGRPWWWILLMLIPFVNIIVKFVIYYDLARSFGKGLGYMLGLVFLPIIFFPMLAFGDATYQGPAAKMGMMPPTPPQQPQM
jgi:hypothetical protein